MCRRFAPLLLCFLMQCGKHDQPESAVLDSTRKELFKALEEFATTEKNKDAEGHKRLFLSGHSTVNFLLANNGKLSIASPTVDQWIGIFTGWPYDYFVKYQDYKFYLAQSVAIERHRFYGYKNNEPQINGEDVFTLVQSEGGWKVANVSSIVFNANDTSDYELDTPLHEDPKIALKKLQLSVNTGDTAMLNDIFTATASPLLIWDAKKNAITDCRALLMERLAEKKSMHLNPDFVSVQVTVYDKYLAVATLPCVFDGFDDSARKGTLLVTLIFSPGDNAWKISSAALSGNYS